MDSPEFNDKSVCDLFNFECNPKQCCFAVDSIGEAASEYLYIIPSSQSLALMERKMAKPEYQIDSIKCFKRNLHELSPYFDYVFIDCLPGLGYLLTTALYCANKVIVPTKAEYLCEFGLQLLMDTIEEVRSPKNDIYNKNLEVAGVIVNMFRANVNEQQIELEQLSSKYEILGIISLSAIVNKGIPQGIPVVVYSKRSKVAKEHQEIASKLL